jgi:hypothetical protein
MRVNTLFQRQGSAALGVNYTGYDDGNSDKGKGDGKHKYEKGKSYGKGGKPYGGSSWSSGKSSKGFGGKDSGKGF